VESQLGPTLATDIRSAHSSVATGDTMNQPIQHNAASRRRLAELVEFTKTTAATRSMASGVLAHIAFWDRLVMLRWKQAFAAGQPVPEPLDLSMTDFINDAAFPQWRQIAFDDAVNDVLRTAAELDLLIEGLDERVVDELTGVGRGRLVDRSLHRIEHIEELERSLKRLG
jgi:hypothetical protein